MWTLDSKDSELPDAQTDLSLQANLKNIFVSPYPTLFYRYGSFTGMGRSEIIFF